MSNDSNQTRRDFLKTAGTVAASPLFSHLSINSTALVEAAVSVASTPVEALLQATQAAHFNISGAFLKCSEDVIGLKSTTFTAKRMRIKTGDALPIPSPEEFYRNYRANVDALFGEVDVFHELNQRLAQTVPDLKKVADRLRFLAQKKFSVFSDVQNRLSPNGQAIISGQIDKALKTGSLRDLLSDEKSIVEGLHSLGETARVNDILQAGFSRMGITTEEALIDADLKAIGIGRDAFNKFCGQTSFNFEIKGLPDCVTMHPDLTQYPPSQAQGMIADISNTMQNTLTRFSNELHAIGVDQKMINQMKQHVERKAKESVERLSPKHPPENITYVVDDQSALRWRQALEKKETWAEGITGHVDYIPPSR